MTDPPFALLSAPGSLDPARARHAVELVNRATTDLARVDPARPGDPWINNHPAADLLASAHIARAALDHLADACAHATGTWPDPPDNYDDLAAILGLAPAAIQSLITWHFDDGTDLTSATPNTDNE